MLALSDFFLPSSVSPLPSSFQDHRQINPIPGRFTDPVINQRVIGIDWVDENGYERDAADPRVELEKEVGQGGTERDFAPIGHRA